MTVLKMIAHSKMAIGIAMRYGWLPGACYKNQRDVKNADQIGFIDIDWKNYDFNRHFEAVKRFRPLMTVAKDIENFDELDFILGQARAMADYCKYIIVVPKDARLIGKMDLIPRQYILGFSVPTRYGGTEIPTQEFNRPVHLLGGRPDVQRRLAEYMPVVSIDCNRFTLDARYGDYFDGERFRPHPVGGYENCLRDSVININKLWESYQARW